MSKRRTKNNSFDGCLGFFLILGFLVYLFQTYWEAIGTIALIIGIGFLIIWAISKTVESQNSSNAKSAPVSTVQSVASDKGPITSNAFVSTVNASNNTQSIISVVKQSTNEELNVCHEINRQITEMLVRRKELMSRIDKTQKAILKTANTSRYGDVEKNQYALIDQKKALDGRLNATVYTFQNLESVSFVRLKSAIEKLASSSAKTYDRTPACSTLVIPYNPIGDMKNILFSTVPLCLSIGDDIFCIIPSYIIRFKNNGAFVTTYTCKAIDAKLENGLFDEQVTHYRWLYSRQDGGPDLRYKNNRRISYQTTRKRTVPNMLCVELSGNTLKYDVDNFISNIVVTATQSYNTAEPLKVYDPVYHVIRLLESCDDANLSIKKLKNILNGDDYYIDCEDDKTEREKVLRQQKNDKSKEDISNSVKKNSFLKVFFKVVITVTIVSSVALFGPSMIASKKNQTPSIEDTIETVLPGQMIVQESTGIEAETSKDAQESVITQTTISDKEISKPASISENEDKNTQRTIETQEDANIQVIVPDYEVSELVDIPESKDISIQRTNETQQKGNIQEAFQDNKDPNVRTEKYNTLHNGDQNNDVEKLERRLIDLGYMTGPSNDYYGPVTETAIQLFQRSAGLPITGIADEKTQEMLFTLSLHASNSGKQNNHSNEQTIESDQKQGNESNNEQLLEPIKTQTSEMKQKQTSEVISAKDLIGIHGLEFAQKSKSNEVKYIQRMLVNQSYLSSGRANGSFGSSTKDAVISFQERNGLSPTGVADIATQYRLAELETGFHKVDGKDYEYAGLKHYGVYRFDDGIYIGLIRNDKSYQKGTLVYKDGTTYAGAFQDNKRSGKGEAWYPNGDYYSGTWKNDLMNGKGIYHFGSMDSIEQYDGEWIDGKMSGKGIYTLPDGKTIKGRWENNQHVGW